MKQLIIVLFIIITGIILINNYLKKKKFVKPKKLEATNEQVKIKNKMLNQSTSEFDNSMTEIRKTFPFDYLYNELFKENEMEQYTLENCKEAERIMNTLIEDLSQIGLQADEKTKLEKFKKAVLAYNKLNDENGGALIETGEREDLCEIIDQIGTNCGLIPKQYGAGDGIASEWRNW